MTPEEMQEEIKRLREQLYLANESATSSSAHAATLRAAIERVRALHAPIEIASKKFCDECNNETEYWVVPHPCPTLRALDGEDA